MECENCAMKPRIDALEKAQENNAKSHAEMYNRLNTLEINHAISNTNYGNIMQSFGELKKDLEDIQKSILEIKERPVKSLDSFKGAILGAIGVAIGGAIVSMFLQFGG